MGPLLKDQLCFALYSTSGAITKAYGELLKPHQLTYPQFVVLMALWQHNGASVTQLAKVVSLSKATLTPILKKLESTGFLRRENVPDNDRTKSIVLSKKGQDFATQGETIAKLALCATGLDDTEAEQLIALCNTITANL